MAFISVDASTNSMAFAIFTYDNALSAFGKIIYNHDSKSIYDRAGVIGKKSGATVSSLIERFEVRTMIIETPIFANSPYDRQQPCPYSRGISGCFLYGGHPQGCWNSADSVAILYR